MSGEPKTGDIIRWIVPTGRREGMVIAIRRAPFVAEWNGNAFVIVPATDEYLVEIACADGVRLIGKAQLFPSPPVKDHSPRKPA